MMGNDIPEGGVVRIIRHYPSGMDVVRDNILNKDIVRIVDVQPPALESWTRFFED
jgi:hypothetical protein